MGEHDVDVSGQKTVRGGYGQIMLLTISSLQDASVHKTRHEEDDAVRGGPETSIDDGTSLDLIHTPLS